MYGYSDSFENTQQKIIDVKRLTDISDVRLLSVCCPIYRMTNVPVALFVHWSICAQIVNRTFVHKRLMNNLFAVRLCTNGWPIYRNENEKKIQ